MTKPISDERSSKMIQAEGPTDFIKAKEENFTSETSELGKLLKEGRQKYKLNQKELAEKINISATIINRIESGATKKPSRKVLMAIAPYTGLGLSELLFCAGYSSDMDREEYYSIDGKKIPHLEIIKEIYSTDVLLLEELKNINILEHDDVDILIKTIRIMKTASELNRKDDTRTNIWMQIFKATKKFIIEQISVLASILQPEYVKF